MHELLVRPENMELTEECQEVSGLTEEALTSSASLEEAIDEVTYLIHPSQQLTGVNNILLAQKMC